MKKETIVLEIPGEWTRSYTIYEELSSGLWYPREVASTFEEADRKAKAYVHLAAVKVDEHLTRNVRQYKKIPVCT